jgi:hypothetical protein
MGPDEGPDRPGGLSDFYRLEEVVSRSNPSPIIGQIFNESS